MADDRANEPFSEVPLDDPTAIRARAQQKIQGAPSVVKMRQLREGAAQRALSEEKTGEAEHGAWYEQRYAKARAVKRLGLQLGLSPEEAEDPWKVIDVAQEDWAQKRLEEIGWAHPLGPWRPRSLMDTGYGRAVEQAKAEVKTDQKERGRPASLRETWALDEERRR